MSSISSSSEGNSGSKGKNGGVKGGGVKRGTEKQGELATKVLMVQSKRFFLDVKQNERGRFIKLAEVAIGGKKSRIFMSMRTSNQLKDYLKNFIEIFSKLRGDTFEETEPKLIHSETIVNDKRRYYVDLRENTRGYFLRVTQISVQYGHRFSVTMPAQGMAELRNALIELLDEFADDSLKVELPEARSMRSENKNFYFDPDQNDRGAYLKISEVKPAFAQRATITVSARSLPQFCAILNDLQAKISKLDTTSRNNKDNKSASASEKTTIVTASTTVVAASSGGDAIKKQMKAE